MLLNTGVSARVLSSEPRRSLFRIGGGQNDCDIELVVQWITFSSRRSQVQFSAKRLTDVSVIFLSVKEISVINPRSRIFQRIRVI
jgi:hypothetical protein